MLGGEHCLVLRREPEGDFVPLLEGGGSGRLWGQSLLAKAIESRRPVVACSGASAESAEMIGSDSILLEGMRSALCAPIMVDGEVKGAFVVSHRLIDGLFGPEEQRVAEFIATLAGASLERLRSYQQVEQLVDQLRRQVAERSRQLLSVLAASHKDRAEFPALAAGDTIRDRYVVVRELGAGAMGVVFQARPTHGEGLVAIKVPQALRGQSLARMAREAMVIAQVDHPNVVKILDVDVTDEGLLYLVMEYVKGRSLSECREHFGDIPWALDVLAQVAEGLMALHELRIIHRDLKLSNVMLTSAQGGGRECVKIMDFGISRLEALDTQFDTKDGNEQAAGQRDDQTTVLGNWRASEEKVHDAASQKAESETDSSRSRESTTSSNQELTDFGSVSGTPFYMAPELAYGSKAVTAAADVFAFGLIAHELLTTQRAFAEPCIVAAKAGRILDAPPLSARCPALPGQIAGLLMGCLSFDPGKRPTIVTLREALRR
jgi:serine/threonine-protein kinase